MRSARRTTIGGVLHALGGLLLLDMALTRIAFLLVCLDVRAELGPSRATTELVVPALLRSAAAAVLFLANASHAATLLSPANLRHDSRLSHR